MTNIPAAWPFDWAVKIQERLIASKKPTALFETGYGPSGLPHIGTLSEVTRTSWVQAAFTSLTGTPSKLLAFSDDMDALRRVPSNVPEQDMLSKHLGLPLSKIPDPFGTHQSFSDHNNARLIAFLDSFGLKYEFASSSEYYRSGRFNQTIKKILEEHGRIVDVIAPTLGEERRATYSPILPIHPRTGRVMEVKIDQVDPQAGTVLWQDPSSGERFETSAYSGGCKMQWKVDWAMRWAALGVDFEMSGKDLIDSVKLSTKIAEILGAAPPVSMTYELFLDEQGKKVSKSKGNGLAVEDWLRFGPKASLSYFIYGNPSAAKPVHRKLIPKITDDYLTDLGKTQMLDGVEQKVHASWYINEQKLDQPNIGSPITYAMLLNLANVTNAQDPGILWEFLGNYRPDVVQGQYPLLDEMVEKSLMYYKEFVQPHKAMRDPNDTERTAFEDLINILQNLPKESDAETIQFHVYEVGKRHPFSNLRDWFKGLYQVLLGQDEGPRFGHFIRVYGIDKSIELLQDSLERGLSPKL